MCIFIEVLAPAVRKFGPGGAAAATLEPFDCGVKYVS
jgi:hypothetical protein